MTRSPSFLASAALFILAILGGVFLWQPERVQVEELEKNLVAQETALAELQKEVNDLVALEASLPVNAVERERILETVPLEIAQDELVQDLSQIADQVGIVLNSMTFGLHEAIDPAQADVVSIMANFTGDYADLLTLLRALETNERLFKVTSIGVQLGETTEEGVLQMIFSVSLEAYYQD